MSRCLQVALNGEVDGLRTELSSSHTSLDTQLKSLRNEVEQSIIDHRLNEEVEFMTINDRINEVQAEMNGAVTSGIGHLQVRGAARLLCSGVTSFLHAAAKARFHLIPFKI